jgi:hypothetical protein
VQGRQRILTRRCASHHHSISFGVWLEKKKKKERRNSLNGMVLLRQVPNINMAVAVDFGPDEVAIIARGRRRERP